MCLDKITNAFVYSLSEELPQVAIDDNLQYPPPLKLSPLCDSRSLFWLKKNMDKIAKSPKQSPAYGLGLFCIAT